MNTNDTNDTTLEGQRPEVGLDRAISLIAHDVLALYPTAFYSLDPLEDVIPGTKSVIEKMVAYFKYSVFERNNYWKEPMRAPVRSDYLPPISSHAGDGHVSRGGYEHALALHQSFVAFFGISAAEKSQTFLALRDELFHVVIEHLRHLPTFRERSVALEAFNETFGSKDRISLASVLEIDSLDLDAMIIHTLLEAQATGSDSKASGIQGEVRDEVRAQAGSATAVTES